MSRRLFVLFLFCGACSKCDPPPAKTVDASPPPIKEADSPGPSLAPKGFLKGQLHAHSNGSGDSSTPPEEVHRFYEEHGYDFVVFTDHNVVTDTPDSDRTLTFPGVELTRNLNRCEPQPPNGNSCSLHTNALFVADADTTKHGRIDFAPPKSLARREAYIYELKRAKELGGLAMLCHPNLLFSGPDEATIFELTGLGLSLMEIRNEAWDSENAGDANHPSTEALWDGVLNRGAHLFATATDDAHHYADAPRLRAAGERPFDGNHAFVIVRADKTAASIRNAISKGDFYSSTGLILKTYDTTTSRQSMTLEAHEPIVFEVIARGGTVIRREESTRRLEVKLTPEDGPYVRVRMKRLSDGAQAWSQPIFRANARD
jgi:hypothetical protein